MNRIELVAYCAAGVGIAISLASCSSKSTSPVTPTPVPLTHMYLSLDSSPGGSIQIYSAPVTSASTPTGTITPLAGPAELFVDNAGRLFVPLQGLGTGTTVGVFASPITASSVPAYLLTTSHPNPEDTTEDSAGNVYVGEIQTNCCIDVYTGPVTGAASPSYTINSNGVVTNPLSDPYGMSFDGSGNLYVSSSTSIIKYTPPFPSTSVPAANVTPNQDNYGLLVDASNRVFVADATVDGTIDVFVQPFQNGSARSFGINVSIKYIQGMAFDGSGNLWCTDGNGAIWEIAAPISSTSTATKILTVVGAYGIAFGP